MVKNFIITETKITEKKGSEDGEIREISTKEELTELMERMPYIKTIQAPTLKIRKELYEISMQKYEDIEWVRVIKSVYLRMKEQRYEDFEIEYMERAKFFLYGEIAIRFDIPINQVEEFVNDTVKKYLEEF